MSPHTHKVKAKVTNQARRSPTKDSLKKTSLLTISICLSYILFCVSLMSILPDCIILSETYLAYLNMFFRDIMVIIFPAAKVCLITHISAALISIFVVKITAHSLYDESILLPSTFKFLD